MNMTILSKRPPKRTVGAPARCLLPAALILGFGALGLSACGWVEMGDSLTRDLPPGQAAACRQTVAKEIARQGIGEEQVRRIHFQRQSISQRGATRQGAGFQAWVYPKKEGSGALIIDLTESCEVRDVRYHLPSRGMSEERR